jgi:hypothetical protein
VLPPSVALDDDGTKLATVKATRKRVAPRKLLSHPDRGKEEGSKESEVVGVDLCMD